MIKKCAMANEGNETEKEREKKQRTEITKI